MNRKAIIFGIKGTKLTAEESLLLRTNKPWGIILFSRNIVNISQLQNLISKIKYIAKDKNYPILIDQEGGRISRLNKIIDLSIFSQDYFGRFYKQDKKKFYHYFKIYIDSVCQIMKKIGININTVPVLDVRRKNSHNIIGDRSFSKDPKVVATMGQLCINLYKKNKIATIVKHIPGHGLSKCDSHYNLPIIKAKKSELISNDFLPFKKCDYFFAMTGHVVYRDLDPMYSVTHSKIIINDIIRKHIKFRGLLISDDISMKALKYSLKENAIKALDAGCNLILHCNGNIKEMNNLVKIIPTIDNFIQKKTSQFYKFLG